jgi:hypothetical protein
MEQNLSSPDTPARSQFAARNTGRDGAGQVRCAELRQFRVSKRESQEKFWRRFGVTQSSGSRFETGLDIPPTLAILVKLYVNGTLSDGDLPG